MGHNGSDTYVLRGGRQGAERLKLLARVKWPTTKTLLKRVGLRPGMHCLDAGCGIGTVTIHLARWTGPAGRAVGIDVDEDCLELARQRAHRQQLHPVFRAECISDLREAAAYDLVYSRFLLSHLRQPGEAVVRMVLAARSGGLVVVEDIDFTGYFCWPACPAFDRYVSLYQRAVQRKGGDANLGPRLLGLLLDAGLEQVDLKVVQPTFRHGPGKRLAPVTMEHIREAVVEAGLAIPAEVDQLVAELDRFARDSRTILGLPRIFQVWGRKPQAGEPAR
jgi:SAM-dependent methyltransferase